jgi:hypothetical protein
MKYPPSIDIAWEELPKDPKERHEFFVDVFGKLLFWALNEAQDDVEALVEAKELREKLGRLAREPFELAAGKLAEEERKIAYKLVNEALCCFARRLLAVLSARGISHRMGQKHAIQFRLVLEVREIEDLGVAAEEVINRGGKKAFSSYWGRWLQLNLTRQP